MEPEMSLASARIGQSVQVREVRLSHPLAARLMEMGFVGGATAEIMGRAPLGDPLRVRIGDSRVSIRSSEAELVEIVRD
jgi:ferrous iron transport protein A